MVTVAKLKIVNSLMEFHANLDPLKAKKKVPGGGWWWVGVTSFE